MKFITPSPTTPSLGEGEQKPVAQGTLLFGTTSKYRVTMATDYIANWGQTGHQKRGEMKEAQPMLRPQTGHLMRVSR